MKWAIFWVLLLPDFAGEQAVGPKRASNEIFSTQSSCQLFLTQMAQASPDTWVVTGRRGKTNPETSDERFSFFCAPFPYPEGAVKLMPLNTVQEEKKEPEAYKEIPPNELKPRVKEDTCEPTERKGRDIFLSADCKER
ncbi:MAG: hypothetical protein VYE04_18925 [Pseudomonadota bacterium]|nr:hypothetical protein [Pseudomonadota bacterium]